MLTSEKKKKKKARSDVNAGITHFDVKRKARLDMNAGITHIDVKRKARPDMNAGITHAAVKRNARSDISAGVTVMRQGPFLTGRMFVRPNILRTLRRTMIRFLIELLVRRIWFGQSKLYFILNWLVMRCKLRPELAADAQQTA